jgi:hypothetical protein
MQVRRHGYHTVELVKPVRLAFLPARCSLGGSGVQAGKASSKSAAPAALFREKRNTGGIAAEKYLAMTTEAC